MPLLIEINPQNPSENTYLKEVNIEKCMWLLERPKGQTSQVVKSHNDYLNTLHYIQTTLFST